MRNTNARLLNYYNFFLPLAILLLFTNTKLSAQQKINLTLEEAIARAKDNSPDALVAKTKLRNSYWQYRTYRADYFPLLSGAATLPDLNRSFTKITLPDGSDAFVDRSVVSTSANLNINQRIGLTGGTLFATTGLQRIDLLNPQTQAQRDNPTSYLSTPMSFGFTQPVFGFNNLRWQKQIEPIRYKIAKRQYAEDVENISLSAVEHYFDLLSAQTGLTIAKTNQANNDTLFKISQGRYNLGKIAENELLQIQLNLLNANLALQEAQITYEAASTRLKSFLGISIAQPISLEIPTELDTTDINLNIAWQQAQNNSVRALGYDRSILEAARDVAQAEGNNGFKGDFFAAYGLNKRTNQVNNIYVRPEDQQQLRFGVTFPIVDWGRSKAAVEVAKAQHNLTQANIKREKIDFEQEVYQRVMRYNLQKKQVEIAQKANEVAQRRYFIAKQRYLLGKILITDINIAQTERDAAQRAYIESMRAYWQNYINLRKTTLYDFKTQHTLDSEVTLPE